MFRHHHEDDLDPRRYQRGIRRDWKSASYTVTIPRLHSLLTSVLVRLGIAR